MGVEIDDHAASHITQKGRLREEQNFNG